MKEKYDVVVLSPHLDDAVFSLGQHLIDWRGCGKKIKVVNIFSGFGKENIELEKERQSADAIVLNKLGISRESWKLIDGGFRDRENLGELFNGTVSKNDRKLQLIIEKKMAGLSAKTILVPMAVGNHIDHTLVRNAAEKVFQKGKLKYYVESPYLWWQKNWLVLFNWKKIVSFRLGSREKIALAKAYGDEYKTVIRKARMLLVEAIVSY